MIELKLIKKDETKIKRGYPLIMKDAVIGLESLKKEGTLFKLLDQDNQFLAIAYYGIQNKGIGWVLTRNEKETIDHSFFKRKIDKALKRREAYFLDPNTTAFRVFNNDGDDIGGLTIDYYAGYYLINWYSEGIYSFREEIYQALQDAKNYQGIYEKKRFDTKGAYIEQDDFVMGKEATFPLIIKENGMNYAVNLNDGAMTGIFLDQRDVRQLIREKYAKNKTILNTFSYTGAFSVAALHGGATKTINVDLAKRSKSMTKEQFSVNGFDSAKEEIRVMDVFNYFRYAKRHELTFDMVILDPPSFARSKKYTFSTAKDYPALISDAIAITKKNGIIVASTNNASFGMRKFKQFIDKGFKDSHTKYKILEEKSLPNDFRTNKEYPESNYLKVVFLQKL